MSLIWVLKNFVSEIDKIKNLTQGASGQAMLHQHLLSLQKFLVKYLLSFRILVHSESSIHQFVKCL